MPSSSSAAAAEQNRQPSRQVLFLNPTSTSRPLPLAASRLRIRSRRASSDNSIPTQTAPLQLRPLPWRLGSARDQDARRVNYISSRSRHFAAVCHFDFCFFPRRRRLQLFISNYTDRGRRQPDRRAIRRGVAHSFARPNFGNIIIIFLRPELPSLRTREKLVDFCGGRRARGAHLLMAPLMKPRRPA